MLRKLVHALLILALVAAVGGHWAVLQTMAWTNMLATNLRNASLGQAVTRTFDGQHPCRLCKAISAGQKAEKKSDLPNLAKKLEFLSDPSRTVFSPPNDFWLQAVLQPTGAVRIYVPPLPPPRSILS